MPSVRWKLALTALPLFAFSLVPPAIACEAPPQAPQTKTLVAQSPLTDTRLIPGERVGPVTARTTRRDLVRLFGANRLSDRTIQGPEGIGTFAATRVNLGPQRSFTVVWSDTSRTKPLDVRELGTGWKTPEGIGVGSTMADLRRILGEFKLTGLGWDYGGNVLLEKTRLDRYQGKLWLRVEAAPNAGDRYAKDYEAVSGDQVISSSNRHWQPLGIRVWQMVIPLNKMN